MIVFAEPGCPRITSGQMHPTATGITYAWVSKGQGPGSASTTLSRTGRGGKA